MDIILEERLLRENDTDILAINAGIFKYDDIGWRKEIIMERISKLVQMSIEELDEKCRKN
jgi:hypothetical protein